jgi:hypothetical protein
MNRRELLAALIASPIFPAAAKALDIRLPGSPVALPDPLTEQIRAVLAKHNMVWHENEIAAIQKDYEDFLKIHLERLMGEWKELEIEAEWNQRAEELKNWMSARLDEYISECAKVDPHPYKNRINANVGMDA